MSVDDTLMCSFQILKPQEKGGKTAVGNTGSRPTTPGKKNM